MNISIQSSRVELTPSIKTRVIEKLEKIARFGRGKKEMILDAVIAMDAKSKRKGNVFRTDLSCSLPGEGTFQVTASDENLYRSIDEAQKELIVELKKHKGQKESKFLRGARELKNGVRNLSFGA